MVYADADNLVCKYIKSTKMLIMKNTWRIISSCLISCKSFSFINQEFLSKVTDYCVLKVDVAPWSLL